MYKRIILKLSGEALSGDTDKSFDNDTINKIILQIKEVIEKVLRFVLLLVVETFGVVEVLMSLWRTKADQIGMMATIMNAIYLSDSFMQNGIDSVVMTPFIVGNMTEQFNKQKALNHLLNKKVLIFAGGIGHPFFSTDTITALRACELEADAILFAKSIDGVYDKDPAKYNDAKKFDEIPCKDIVEKNLQVIDIAAANLCYEYKIPVIIFGLLEKDSIIKASIGEKIGTIVTI